MTDVFSDKLQAWRDYTASPWGRIRYAVVAETLRRQCADLGERLRILDVGGGDAMDSLPLARAGHDVTVLDPSEAWLGEATRRAGEGGVALTTIVGGLDDLPLGEWDLVLCHFVLQYRPADAADVGALAALLRPGGRLSLMTPNPDGRLLRELVLSGPAAARAELERDTVDVVTFDTTVRKVPLERAVADVERAGLRVAAVYGNRVANDLIADNAVKDEPAFFADLLDLELALCDREPFNRVGFAWQLVAERPAT
jgi:S-adenosylmethionine-dependent methyltransferase